jgi:hypothetical protein
MVEIMESYINKELNNTIKNYVYKNKHKWEMNLNNVQALTSGFNPKYKFFNELYNLSYKFLKKNKGIEYKKSCWWVNFYKKNNKCFPHDHIPEDISAILIVKSSNKNPLYFLYGNKKIKFLEKDGMLLFFNSKLTHGVEKCKDERITCSLDFKKNYEFI